MNQQRDDCTERRDTTQHCAAMLTTLGEDVWERNEDQRTLQCRRDAAENPHKQQNKDQQKIPSLIFFFIAFVFNQANRR